MFENYPDVVTVEQVMEMLNLGKNKTYELLMTNKIQHIRVGNRYIIPKKAVIEIFSGLWYNDSRIINDRLQSVEKGA